MNRDRFFFVLFLLLSPILFSSCIKNLDQEGVYLTTRCHGVLIDEATLQPIEGLKVVTTDGLIIGDTVHSAADGSFDINIHVEELNRGYYISIQPDSLYEAFDIKLDSMPLGIQTYQLGSFYIQGPDVPFVSTDYVDAITPVSSHCYGSIVDSRNSTIVEHGFVYSVMQYPTVDDRKVVCGSGEGAFDAVLSSLDPHTTYYVRAYAYNSLGIGYGNQVSFTTLNGLAEVSVQSINNITATAASAVAEVLNDGGFSVTSRGICWGTAPMPTISNTHTSNGAGTGRFSVDMPQLQPGTVYYVRAYAQNRAGVSYSEQLTFSTASGLPVLTTRPASQVTSTSAVAGGSISDDGGFPVIRRGVCYSTVPQPTVDGFHTTDGSGTGSFTSQLLNLASGTHYYFRAYATNSVGTVYGEQFEFVTQ